MSRKDGGYKGLIDNTTPNKNKKDTSPIVFQKEKLDWELKIRERPDFTDNQKTLIDSILDKDVNIVFISGPAGSSKSFTAVYSALKLLNAKKISSIIYTKPILESADSGAKIGFLPGDQSQKLEPHSQVLYDKLEELLNKNDIKRLETENRIDTIPVNYARGLNWVGQCIVVDEAQNFVMGELKTLLTRISKFSKMIVLFDPGQSDLPLVKQGACVKLFDLFNCEESNNFGIRCYKLTEDDIVRSEICKYIVTKFQEIK